MVVMLLRRWCSYVCWYGLVVAYDDDDLIVKRYGLVDIFLRTLESLINTRFLYYPFDSSCRCRLSILTTLFDLSPFSFIPFCCHPKIKSGRFSSADEGEFLLACGRGVFFVRRWENDGLRHTLFLISAVLYPLVYLRCCCLKAFTEPLTVFIVLCLPRG